MVLSPTGKVLYANQPMREVLHALQSREADRSSAHSLPPSFVALMEELLESLVSRRVNGNPDKMETRMLALTAEHRSYVVQAFGLVAQPQGPRVVITSREIGSIPQEVAHG
jgi:hypothetical protein